MSILIVDNNLHLRGYPQGLILRAHLGLKEAANAAIVNPGALSERDCEPDRVILTGSTAYIRQENEWMDRERAFIDAWMKRGVPILGICFGAQLLARHLFGKEAITALPYPISGSIRIRYKEGTSLFEGLPNPFGGVTTHYEGFIVPEAYRVAEIDEWPHYAFSFPGGIHGVQFHPELMDRFGKWLVRIQRQLFDRHVYQDFDVKTRGADGRRLLANFVRG